MKPETKHKLYRETESLLALFIYLALLLGGLTIYRRLILEEYKIAYFQYGYSAIEALLLAKVIMLGRHFHVGERFDDRPLIIGALYKTVAFSVFVLVFGAIEHIVSACLKGRGFSEAIHELMSKGITQVLAETVVLYIAFIPLFSIWEIGGVVGEGNLFDLFFKKRKQLQIVPIEK